MKILLINNLYGKYAKGGAERVVEALTLTLSQGERGLRHDVVVISTRPCRLLVNKNQVGNALRVTCYELCVWNLISYYNLHKLPKVFRLFWHAIDMFNVQSYFKIKKILKNERPDIVMTHNLKGVGFLTARAIKKFNNRAASAGLRRARHIHTLHDIQLLHPSGLMMVGEEKKVDSWLARLYQWCNKKLFASVDVVISPSRWLLDEHVKRGFFTHAKREVMANPISTPPSPPLVGGGNTNKEAFIFLYVGQIERHKGIEILIEAFKNLENNSCELWIVGNVETLHATSLRRKYEHKSIQFLGRKTPEDVRSLMQQAHCLVIPSLCYENQPTIMIEASQNNLPVIASNCGGIVEMVDSRFLFPAGDREALRRKMEWVMEHYTDIKASGISQLRNVSASAYVEKLLAL